MKVWVIRRAEVVDKVGDCTLIEVFDATVARARSWRGPRPDWRPSIVDGDLVYENGWKPENTRNLLDASPRAFVLMARAGLVPLSEKDALQMMLREGKTYERLRPPVANVQHVNLEDSLFMLRMRVTRRPRAPRSPAPARVISIED